MKKLIVLMSLLAITAVPVMASVCPDGETWSEDIVPGYFTDGPCNSWSTPVCKSVCPSGYHPSIRKPNKCWKPCGWSVCYKNKIKQCSKPICLAYDQIWNEPVDNGSCTALPTPDPTQRPDCGRGEYNGTCHEAYYVGETLIPGYCEGTCGVELGGPSIYQRAARISSKIELDGRNVAFTTSKFGTGCLLLRPISDTRASFAISSVNRVHDYYIPQGAFSYFGSENNYGYPIRINFDGSWTRHYGVIPYDVEAGTYHARACSLPDGELLEVFSHKEQVITIN